MFDWDDEQLTNIIWDEAGETDDHIVPYPKENEERASGLYGDHVKQGSDEEVTNSKPAEEKKPASRSDLTGVKRGRSSQYDTIEGISAAGYGTESWCNLSSSHGVKTDQDPLGIEASDIAKEKSLKDAFPSDEALQLDVSSEVFLNQQEDKEQIDFVDYGWASIGSFDDLDRIFSSNISRDGVMRCMIPYIPVSSLQNSQLHSSFMHSLDQMECMVSSDQTWSSSKDITSVPEKAFPVPTSSPRLASGGAFENTYEHPIVKKEFIQDLDQSYAHPCGETIYLTSQAQENLHSIDGQVNHAGPGVNCQPVAKEKQDLDMLGYTGALNSQLPVETIATVNEYTGKVRKEQKLFKSRKKMERILEAEGTLSQDSYSSWYDGNQIQQFGQIVPSISRSSSSPALKQQTQLQGPWSAHYQQPSNAVVSHDAYESFTTDSTTNSFRETHSIEENKSVTPQGKFDKLRTMTPQEKIEKLRRRQQMQALLAIQKQQQQLSHQVSHNDQRAAQNFLNENPIQLMRGGNTEVEELVSTTPLTGPNSTGEQYGSNTISAAVNDYHSAEEIILHQLQDVVAKLDTKIRLCIRDSLFRLAQSAMQRQYAGDTRSSNLRKDETNSDNRFSEKPGVETDTNPIDRTVAHLLFHRPVESSELHVQTPESPASMKLERHTTTGLLSSPRGFLPEKGKQQQQTCHGSRMPAERFEGPSGNALKDEEAGDAAGHHDMGTEASH